MIKFFTGTSFTYQGEGVYFITPTTEDVPYVQIVVGEDKNGVKVDF